MILFNLSPGQTAIYETLVDNAPQRLGWALIEETSAGVGDMLGQTVFRKQNVGSPDFMTSHLLDFPGFERMSVFFDNTEGKYTGMGILTSDLCILGLFLHCEHVARHSAERGVYRNHAVRRLDKKGDQVGCPAAKITTWV